MNADAINEIVTRAVSEVLRIPADRVTNDLSMQSVDTWDFLKHMELIAALESGLGLELSFDEIVTMKSVGDIRRVLAAHANG